MFAPIVPDGQLAHYQCDVAAISHLEYVSCMHKQPRIFLQIGGCAVPSTVAAAGGMYGAGVVDLPFATLATPRHYDAKRPDQRAQIVKLCGELGKTRAVPLPVAAATFPSSADGAFEASGGFSG